jgi:hypothetical protein
MEECIDLTALDTDEDETEKAEKTTIRPPIIPTKEEDDDHPSGHHNGNASSNYEEEESFDLIPRRPLVARKSMLKPSDRATVKAVHKAPVQDDPPPDPVARSRKPPPEPQPKSSVPRKRKRGPSHALMLDFSDVDDEHRENTDGKQNRSETDNDSDIQDRLPPSDDPLFRNDPLLTVQEMEVLWLGTESIYCDPDPKASTFKWEFIWRHASPALRVELRKLPDADGADPIADEQERLSALVRMDEWLVCRRFKMLRDQILNSLIQGYRRKDMALTIAECLLTQRVRQIAPEEE